DVCSSDLAGCLCHDRGRRTGAAAGRTARAQPEDDPDPDRGIGQAPLPCGGEPGRQLHHGAGVNRGAGGARGWGLTRGGEKDLSATAQGRGGQPRGIQSRGGAHRTDSAGRSGDGSRASRGLPRRRPSSLCRAGARRAGPGARGRAGRVPGVEDGGAVERRRRYCSITRTPDGTLKVKEFGGGRRLIITPLSTRVRLVPVFSWISSLLGRLSDRSIHRVAVRNGSVGSSGVSSTTSALRPPTASSRTYRV